MTEDNWNPEDENSAPPSLPRDPQLPPTEGVKSSLAQPLPPLLSSAATKSVSLRQTVSRGSASPPAEAGTRVAT